MGETFLAPSAKFSRRSKRSTLARSELTYTIHHTKLSSESSRSSTHRPQHTLEPPSSARPTHHGRQVER